MKKPVNLFSWLIDVTLDSQAIHFVLFGVWTFHSLSIENIKSAAEIDHNFSGTQNSGNPRNQFFARSFLIETTLGWMDRRMLVTPQRP